jgi:serine O-acetyltransferase
VAAGSVVLKPVPPNTTVAGVPARVVGSSPPCDGSPAQTMDQVFDFPFSGEGI